MGFWQRKKFTNGTKTKEIKGFITFEIPSDFDDGRFLRELVEKITKGLKGFKDSSGKISLRSVNIGFD